MKTNKTVPPTVEEIQAATAALKEQKEKMPFLRQLTPAERRQHHRIGNNTVRGTAQRVIAAREHRDTLPPSFDLRKFERDTALLVAMNDCLAAATEIQEAMHDTLLSLGQGAVQSGRQALALMQVASSASTQLGETVTRLKRRRGAVGRGEEEPPDTGQATAPPATAATPGPTEPAAVSSPDNNTKAA